MIDWCVILFLPLIFATLDTLVDGNEEGGDYQGFEEDQGQFADQGKPPLDAYFYPTIFLMHVFTYLCKCITCFYYVFFYTMLPMAWHPQVLLLSSIRMTPSP